MNRFNHSLFTALLVVCLLAVTACNEKPAKPAAQSAQSMEKMTIRYLNEDSLLNSYLLAKDINEAVTKLQTQYDAAEKQRSDQINKFGNSMQQKYKNNEYLNEQAFNADQAKLQQMQNDAANYLGGLQRDAQNQMADLQKQLKDKVDAFVADYAKKNNIDLVLYKSATLFIDEKYDITNDVIEGLNKEYNKVGKKPEAPAEKTKK